MLSSYRILDLTDERGLLAGQILAGLNADVIQVEPPDGSSARRVGPFIGDRDDPGESLYWWAYARGKRGITCDIDQAAGRDLLIQLAESADVLLESDAPGAMQARGLGYADLAAANPALVYVSITAFGQDGPKAHYAASDLILMAAGGPLLATGDPDRAPVRVRVPQAYHHAAAEASTATLIALRERRKSGQGQHVDVSAQQAVALATNSTILATSFGEAEAARAAGGFMIRGYGTSDLHLRLIWPARDGHISLGLFFGSSIGPFTRRLMEWVYEEGGCDVATRDTDWVGYGQLLASGEEPIADFERLKSVVARFTATKTKAELLAAALERKLMIAPISDELDVLENAQFAHRGFWQSVRHDELDGDLQYPGSIAQFSAPDLTRPRPAPKLGEHNSAIYTAELGLSSTAVADLAAKGIL
jgi:crotonobetainyl-CoA:carnitine CoA-transferase CaiB-like acyl-CoA transferase